MVGLNHEMGRELLWRGFPTDQRGTYFDHFWGWGAQLGATTSIRCTCGADAARSATRPASPPRDQFVMLLRSPLLRRYPNAVIYLTPAVLTAGGRAPSETRPTRSMPVFAGSMLPDINFLGFDIPPTRRRRGGGHAAGYYLVIQEHPTEPRFGINTGVGGRQRQPFDGRRRRAQRSPLTPAWGRTPRIWPGSCAGSGAAGDPRLAF